MVDIRSVSRLNLLILFMSGDLLHKFTAFLLLR